MHESAAIIPTKERCISSESVGVLEMDGGTSWCLNLPLLVADFDTSVRFWVDYTVYWNTFISGILAG